MGFTKPSKMRPWEYREILLIAPPEEALHQELSTFNIIEFFGK
ncbi:uncharacterized protein J3R85_011310 [Psidium guajava]|nr:uncharacterized protein J3R85_011310 [Psidium guajava]